MGNLEKLQAMLLMAEMFNYSDEYKEFLKKEIQKLIDNEKTL